MKPLTIPDQIKLALDDIGPMSSLELRTLLVLKPTTTQRYLRILRETKQIHITRKDRQPDGTGGRFAPIYAIGEGHDARAPAVRDASERNKRYRKRHAAIISARRYPHARVTAGVWAGLL